MSDEQDVAESVDEEMVGGDAVTADEVGAFDEAPDRPVGLPFSDADVTDESLAERVAREEPEATLAGTDELEDPDVIVDSDLVERIDDAGELSEPD